MIKVLIPTDFSKPSKAAISYALKLAQSMDAELTLFHAIDAPSHSSTLMRDIDDIISKDAKEDFENFYLQVKDELDIKNEMSREMSVGKPHDAINEYCDENNMDIIVMGNTGEGAMHKLFMGSNTQRVIEESSIPVIAVPHNSPVNDIKEIVYATDMQDTSDELQKLVNFARYLNANISVLHIYKNESDVNKYENAIIEAELKQKHDYEKIHFHTEVNSDIEDGIAHYVIAKRADLLAMFAKKRSFFERLFEKSFTQNIADENDLPLFIYKKDGSNNDSASSS
ncbi:MAG: universal stress protein [Bacteroidia bacterium]|nr:universal stress protein [Bacteroidia bacterium]